MTAQTSVTYAPDRIYATDGHKLSRTDDGGCIWTGLSLPSTPLIDQSPLPTPLPVSAPDGAPHINSISAPSTATSVRFVYLAADLDVPKADTAALPPPLNGTQDPVTQPYAYVSVDGGVHFRASHGGFPALGSVTQIAAAPSGPNIVYATVTDASNGSSGIYRSIDFGLTWKQMSSALPTSLKVNPQVTTSVYGLLSDGLNVSTDSGGSFSRVSHTSPSASYGVAPGGGYIQLVQGFSDANRWERSTNGGNTFVSHLSPVPAKEIATSALSDAVLLAGGTDWLELKTGGAYKASPVTPSVGSLDHVSMGAPVGLTLSVSGVIHTAGAGNLVSRLLFAIGPRPGIIKTLVPVRLQPHGVVKQFPSTLFPFHENVTLGPGQTKDVPYQLLLPRTPTPVDLMFLVDTTSSMDQTINGVRQGLAKIADQLAAVGVDVRFGVAEYRDYPPDDFGNGEPSDYPYRLHRHIAPYGPGLAAAINTLQAAGGGDLDEAGLTALYQSTVGTGQVIVNVDNNRHRVIAPGGQAGYRPHSLRLAVIASDAAYHKESGYAYNAPSWSKALSALLANGVHQVGLAVQTLNNNVPTGFDSLKDMRRMAVDTGTLAPTGGIDCDGDGTVDIDQGSALVCKIPHPAQQKNPAGGILPDPPPPALALANPIADLAANIPDLSSVGIQVAGGPAVVARVISVPSAPIVNLHTDNTLDFTVRYTCPVSAKPHTWDLSLNAVAGGFRPLTSAATTLTCGPKPKPAVIPPAVPELLTGVVAAAAPPAAPPNPPAQGSGNANPNPALNANAGFAQQEDQERQLAFADADQGTELMPESDTSQMSRPARSDDPAMLFVAGAAGLMMAGVATAYARRSRMRTQCARVGTWR